MSIQSGFSIERGNLKKYIGVLFVFPTYSEKLFWFRIVFFLCFFLCALRNYLGLYNYTESYVSTVISTILAGHYMTQAFLVLLCVR